MSSTTSSTPAHRLLSRASSRAQPSAPSVTNTTATAASPSSSSISVSTSNVSRPPPPPAAASLFSTTATTTTTSASRSSSTAAAGVSFSSRTSTISTLLGSRAPSVPSVPPTTISTTTHSIPPSISSQTQSHAHTHFSIPGPSSSSAQQHHQQQQHQHQQGVAQARAAVLANLGNLMDRELTHRAALLHANNAAIQKQERDVQRAVQGLRKENDKLQKVVEQNQKKVKEIGNVQNWAEMLEREFVILEETLRMVREGGGSGDDDDDSGSWSGSEGSGSEGSGWDSEGDGDDNHDAREEGRRLEERRRDGDDGDIHMVDRSLEEAAGVALPPSPVEDDIRMDEGLI